MPTFVASTAFDMQALVTEGSLSEFFDFGTVVTGTESLFVVEYADETVSERLTLTGTFGDYVEGYPTTGTITSITYWLNGGDLFTVTGMSLSVEQFTAFANSDDLHGLFSTVLSGADQVVGSEGNDTLLGFDGSDTILGHGGNDILDGGEGNDTLRGGFGDDSLYGGGGNDLLAEYSGNEGPYGNDLYDGGEGNDRVSYFADYGTGVTIDLNDTNAQATGQGTDTFVSIEHITATYGDDYLTGNDAANWFWTFNGTDSLTGNGGNDYFTVGLGDKAADGGTGVDTIEILDLAFEPLYTADGITVSLDLQGTAQETGVGTWTLTNMENLGGSWGADELTGDANDNILAGAEGDDHLIGGGGNDTLTGDGTFDLDANAAPIALLYASSPTWEEGNDILEGGAGDDLLIGGAGNDILRGGTGSDQLYGGLGNDLLSESAPEGGPYDNDLYDGGEGNDRVSYYQDFHPGVTVDLNVTTAQNTGQGSDTLVSIEHVTSTYGNDTLTGNAGDNWFWTFSGTDVMSGGGGNDYFTVGHGDKTVDGGDGVDTLEIADFAYEPLYGPEGITVSLELQGTAQAVGTGTWTFTNIENLGGFTGDDELTGDGNANVLAGSTGNDTLVGGGGDDVLVGDGTFILNDDGVQELVENNTADGPGGNDILDGGTGGDYMVGGGGDDIYYVDQAGTETQNGDGVIEQADGGTDEIRTSIDWGLWDGLNVENITAVGDGNVFLGGDSGANVITGNTGDNYVIGNGGDDTIDGGAGRDIAAFHVPAGTTGSLRVIDGPDGTLLVQLVQEDGSAEDVFVVTINGDGSATVTGVGLSAGVGTDTVTNVEDLHFLVDTWPDPTPDNQIAFIALSATQYGSHIAGSDGADTIDLADYEGALNANGNGGDDNITGNEFDNYIRGDAGNDTISAGGDGWDVAGYGLPAGTTGTLRVVAGTGENAGKLVVQRVDGETVEDLFIVSFDDETGTATVQGINSAAHLGTDTVSGVESLDFVVDNEVFDPNQFTSIQMQSLSSGGELFGGGGSDVLFGNDGGHDGLRGFGGHDVLFGREGDDFLVGGGGDDYLDGGAGIDRVSYGGAAAGVTVDLNLQGVGQDTGQGVDTLVGIEHVTGSNHNDVLTGDGGDNWFWGLAGTDTISGGAGDDLMEVWEGNHVLTGGEGSDTVVAYGGGITGGITLSLAAQGAAQDTGFGSMTLTGFENLSGTQFDDTLTGDTAGNILAGDHGNDVLNGGAGNDRLYGDGGITIDSHGFGTSGPILWIEDGAEFGVVGDDLLIGGTGNDYIHGGGGIDTASYAGASGSVNVNLTTGVASGADGNDTLVAVENLVGSAHNDVLTGNGVANVIDGGAGNDLLVGGAGNDTYYADAGDTVSEGAGQGTDLVIASANFAIGANVENLTLTGSAVSGTGNSLNNVIIGNAGANVLNGGAGIDTMSGGAGDDTYYVDSGSDVVNELAGEGIDRVYSSGSHALGANVENLSLTGTGNSTGFGNDLANTIVGNSGSNVINGGAGADAMLGGAGDDTYYVDDIGDGASEGAGAGTDQVFSSVNYVLAANIENLTLTGATAVTAGGNALDNIIIANEANNVINGFGGADVMLGGAGDDTYYVDDAGDRASEGAGAGTDQVFSSVDFVLWDNIENLTLTGTTAVTAGGNALDNTIIGNDANNVINGFAGADTMVGGLGNDTYYVDNAGDRASEGVGAGTDLVFSSVDFVLWENIENLTLTGTAVNATGNSLNNVIAGNDMNNVINGGVGVDTMLGGLGNDSYYVDNAADRVSEGVGAGTDQVYSSVSFALWSNVENLTLTGTANLSATGNAQNNVIFGNSGNNVINGAGGADSMLGGAGSDSYYVDNSADVVVENAGAGDDWVYSSASFTLGANIEGLILTGSSALNATGNAQDNIIYGNSGANTLDGGAGADWLEGGAGDDIYYVDNAGDTVVENGGSGTDSIYSSLSLTLGANVENLILTGTGSLAGTGNALDNGIVGNAGANVINGGLGSDTLWGMAGADQFVFDSALGAANVDELLDFSVVDDTIVLDRAVFSALSAGTLAAGAFVNGTAALDADDRIIYDSINGAIYYDADGNGAGEAVLFARVNSGTMLTNADFEVVGVAPDGPTEGDDNLVGTAGDDGSSAAPYDLLGGNDTFDLILGGTDWVNGGAGNDTLIARSGSIGSDNFNGGTGSDTVDFSSLTSSQPVTTSGAGSYSGALWVNLRIGDDYGIAAANTETFILGAGDDIVSFAPISGWGQVVNQGVTVVGGSGDDTITGSNFADTIIGGAGGDVLRGGALADTFVYEALSDSQYLTSWDRIADFAQGVDIIDLSAIDANSVGGTDNDAFTYIGYNAAFTGVAGQLAIMGPEYTAAANAYAVLADLDGDGQGDLRIDISSPTAPTVDDLFL